MPQASGNESATKKEALLVLAALEAWETDSLGVAEEIGIGCIKIAQSTLQGLGVDF